MYMARLINLFYRKELIEVFWNYSNQSYRFDLLTISGITPGENGENPRIFDLFEPFFFFLVTRRATWLEITRYTNVAYLVYRIRASEEEKEKRKKNKNETSEEKKKKNERVSILGRQSGRTNCVGVLRGLDLIHILRKKRTLSIVSRRTVLKND